MTRLASQNLAAPSGMDAQSDPVYMESGKAQLLTNYLIDRPGRIAAQVSLHDALPLAQNARIDGIAYYYGATIQNNVTRSPLYSDLLLWVSSGLLQIATPPDNPFTGTFGNVSPVFGGNTGFVLGSPFFLGKKTRSAALGDELLFVQDGGLLPLRFYADQVYGTGFYRAGIATPATSGTYSNLTLTATGTGLTGTYQYTVTFYDERGRESSPAPLLPIALVNQGTQVTITWAQNPALYGGSNVKGAYVYRNVIGETSVQYRIANVRYNGTDFTTTAGAGDFLFDPSATYDKAADAVIIVGIAAPLFGENDPPNPASIITTFNNRVFANDTTNNATLQISNTGSPTQWAQFSQVATDGARLPIGTDQGDPIVALVPFGSVLGIFKRRGLYFLYGNSIADWQIQPVNLQPCISPDSAARCINSILFLSEDGVYAQSYQAGDVAQKISSEIQPLLLAKTEKQREASVAFFVDNRYHLAVFDTIFVFDFGSNGWTTFQIGASVGPVSDSGTIGQRPPGGPVQECSVTLSVSTFSVDAAGASETVNIMNTGAFPTTYSVNVDWITLGAGPLLSGTLAFTVAPYTGFIQRVGLITICDEVIIVTQGAVVTTISSPSCID